MKFTCSNFKVKKSSNKCCELDKIVFSVFFYFHVEFIDLINKTIEFIELILKVVSQKNRAFSVEAFWREKM